MPQIGPRNRGIGHFLLRFPEKGHFGEPIGGAGGVRDQREGAMPHRVSAAPAAIMQGGLRQALGSFDASAAPLARAVPQEPRR